MNRRFAFTVDLDRDVNLPLKGEAAAGSLDRGLGTGPRFSSSEKGLGILLDLLDEIGIKATVFVEGRTAETIDCSCLSGHCIGLHGYDHEDLLAQDTGVPVDQKAVLTRGFEAVSDRISEPVCFRAPYMRADEDTMSVISSLGIRHDSSVYRRMDEGYGTYQTHCGIVEHPVPKSRDSSGKVIAAYLWPMHEGKRSPEDYIRMAASAESGEFVLATHTWHMAESREDGPMSEERIVTNADNVRRVIGGILDEGFRPSTIAD